MSTLLSSLIAINFDNASSNAAILVTNPNVSKSAVVS
jgi:hypothetical protein